VPSALRKTKIAWNLPYLFKTWWTGLRDLKKESHRGKAFGVAGGKRFPILPETNHYHLISPFGGKHLSGGGREGTVGGSRSDVRQEGRREAIFKVPSSVSSSQEHSGY